MPTNPRFDPANERLFATARIGPTLPSISNSQADLSNFTEKNSNAAA
jgi:hypothetical protein